MSFAEIRDQAVPVRLLRNILRRGRVPHGLLLHGPEGVGKRLTAETFVKALYCEQGDGDACGACLACRKILSGNHPDLQHLHPKKRARIINTETIEELNALAALRPREGQWRTFIFHEAERMNATAQNKFLKTLEEPPGKSVFLLLSEHPRWLLPTIRSRCQSLRFGALSPETVANLLQTQRGIDESTALTLAAVSQGQMSRALAYLDTGTRAATLEFALRLQRGEDPLSLSEDFSAYLAERRTELERTLKAEAKEVDRKEMSADEVEAMKEALEAAVAERVQAALMEYLYLLQTWYRDAWVYQATGDPQRLLNRDQATHLSQAPKSDYGAKLRAIEKARVYLERFIKEDRVFRDLFFALAA